MEKFSLIVMDINHFKKINDTYGHAFGDEAICKVASILKKMSGSCFCVRYGGEKFETEGGMKSFSISVGIAGSKIEDAHGKDVFLKADAQLYQVKQNGRNQVCCE